MKAFLYLQRVVPLAGAIWNRFRFPGLWTGLHVEIAGPGRLVFGNNVRVGERSRIDLLPDSELVIGADVMVGRGAYLWVGHRMRQSIGTHTSVQDFCRLNGNVSIGKGCIFAPNVFISSGTHRFDAIPHLPILEQEWIAGALDRPVRVFDDCWVGVNAVVTPGVTIGRGAVIGANSVVTTDVPPYSVAGGVPARVLRRRLEFKPPARVEAGRATDNPYFYDGFSFHAPENTARISEGDFTLALDSPAARHVRLFAAGNGVQIYHGDHAAKLSSTAKVLEFPIATDATLPFLKFQVDGPCRIGWAEVF